MPCYLRNKAFVPTYQNIVDEVKRRAKAQGKVQPTKAITRQVLKDALNAGHINGAKYYKLLEIVDACNEEKGHVHDHDHEHEKVMV